MSSAFLETITKRRSYYALTSKSPIDDTELQKMIETAIKYAPSAFNSQSSRVVLLLGEDHKALWEIVLESLKSVVSLDIFPKTEEKIRSLSLSYGTLLFFEEQKTVLTLQKQFPSYAQNFPIWSEHASAILQFILWAVLEDAGFGASLQHYNPLIDAKIQEHWNLPKSWKLVAQMPFGTIKSPAAAKEFLPINERFLSFGAK